jgi:UDP:flavonoid glycosyltransferase YjiC (YdhE family)
MTINHRLKPTPSRIAYFISPHGYGHAARSAGIMAALTTLDPALRFEIFTLVPEWFFQASQVGDFGYHPLLTDIGLVQESALRENLPETWRRLAEFLPFKATQLKPIAEKVKALGCQLIVCDIAPLGIAVAREAGIPSVLVENFTWDWIYEGYVKYERRLAQYMAYLHDLFQAADYHIQAAPACDPQPADLMTSPISRKARTPAAQIRQQLGISEGAKAVMVTMGGISWEYNDLAGLENERDTYFIIPGAAPQVERRGNLIALPHHSAFFHPDLINASDAVIGKVGYSTMAEVYQAGVPFGYVARPKFRESQVLADYIKKEMVGLPISEAQFVDNRWLSSLPALLSLPRTEGGEVSGAEQAAQFIYEILS